MKGVSYLVDETGKKTAVILDLRKHRRLWEDIQDRLLIESRRKTAMSFQMHPLEPRRLFVYDLAVIGVTELAPYTRPGGEIDFVAIYDNVTARRRYARRDLAALRRHVAVRLHAHGRPAPRLRQPQRRRPPSPRRAAASC